jgi:hypothetical protein
MSSSTYNSKVFFLFFTAFLSIGIFFYSASLSHSIDCRSDVIYEDADITRTDLAAFRYSLMSIIADGQFLDSKIQKQTLLVDKLKDKVIIISQVRFSTNDFSFNNELFENTLIKSFSAHKDMVGSRLLRKNIQCHSIPRWFEFITPLMLLLLFILYLIVRCFIKPKSVSS